MTYDYFYGQQAEMFAFYRVPKVLFTEDCFWNVSTDAKLLYGILLDRMNLSARNGWLDEEGRVYIIFTIEEIKGALGCAEKKAVKLLDELEIVSRKEPKTGTMTCMYFVFYGLGRFLIEGLRTDSLYIISGIRASQVLSLLLILGGMLLYVVFVRRNKMKHTYLGKYANKDKIS